MPAGHKDPHPLIGLDHRLGDQVEGDDRSNLRPGTCESRDWLFAVRWTDAAVEKRFSRNSTVKEWLGREADHCP